MPSDCQCSSACHTETREITKVINSKEGTKRIARLERELEKLVEENSDLRRRLRKSTVNKKHLIDKIKSGLDTI